jgi:hypothetical protein
MFAAGFRHPAMRERKTMKNEPQRHAPASASRRRFTKTVAAALVAAPLARSVAQTPPAAKEAVAPPNPQPTPSPSPQQQQPPSPLALAYLEVARLRFGEKLSEEEMTRLRRDINGNLRSADALRAVKLKNADEPDFVFSA